MTNQQVPIRAAMYLRVSTEDQTEKYGIELQQAAIEGIIKAKGMLDNGQPAMVLAGEQFIYKDEGFSGTIPVDERPAFLRMKEDIENAPEGRKPFDIVAVYRVDRFARRLKILLDVTEYFEDHDIQFISANESIDTTTPFGKAILGIIGVIAELEIETTKARTQAGRAQAREKGVYMGSSAPYGYIKNKDKRLEILKPEAKIVEEIFELYVVQKKNAQQIADHLKNKKILTPLPSSIYFKKRKEGSTKINDPHFWRDSTIRDIINDEAYLGNYYFNKTKDNKPVERSKWELSPYHHVPIVDVGIFEMAQRRVKEDIALRNSAKTADNHLYLLSGLLKCHACHDPYSGREPLNWTGTSKVIKKSKIRAYYYQCGAKNSKKYSTICQAIPFPADEIEQFVADFIRNLLEDPESVYKHVNSLESTKASKKYLTSQRERVVKELNQIPIRRGAIKIQHEEGYIKSPEEFKERMANVDKREIELNKELSGIDYQIGENSISDIYIRTLELFAKKYKVFLDGAMKDRQELFDLIHLIVDRIHVYSRKMTKNDVIAGRKKEGQKIPYKIRIDLRLPQDMMTRLARDGKFEVKNRQLWAREDSNLHAFYGTGS